MVRAQNPVALIPDLTSSARSRHPLLGVLVGGLLLVAVDGLLARSSRADDPSPQPSSSTKPSVPRLPMVAAQGPPSRLEGKIIRSSRGRKGPVRVLVERQGGEKILVLVAPDEYCERLGLSLRTGESVDVEGAMLKGERPILIASAITADGKTVRIRDQEGKLLELDAPSAATSPGGGSESRGNATVMGGKGPSDPAPQ